MPPAPPQRHGRPNFPQRLERLLSLPAPLRERLNAEATERALAAIAQHYRLDEEAQGTLAELTGMVLLGELHPNQLIRAVEVNLRLTREQARSVALDVSREIFSPVRNELLALYRIAPGGAGAVATTAAPPSQLSGTPQPRQPESQKPTTPPVPAPPQSVPPPARPPAPPGSTMDSPHPNKPSAGGLPPRPQFPPRPIDSRPPAPPPQPNQTRSQSPPATRPGSSATEQYPRPPRDQ